MIFNKLIPIVLLCVSCSATEQVVAVKPEVPSNPCPTLKTDPCTDQIQLIDDEDLKKGFSCPNNSKLVFPSHYQIGKILVLCQCK